MICPSLTWCSTANAALYLGARPVFCDVDPHSLCATPESVRRQLTPRTRAVIVVHYGGLAADVAGIRAILPPNVALIEDAAHALGARYPDDRPVGSSGQLTCFSFYANKNLSTGEGGAVALADHQLADRLRSLRQHGLPLDAWKRFTHPQSILLSNQLTEIGYKANYTDLQAAIGRVQLRRQPEFATRRRAIAQIYNKGLRRLKPAPLLQSACTEPNHARHLFTAQFPFEKLKLSREEFILALRARNLGATFHYAPLHTMPLYRGRRRPAPLPNTERVAKSIVTLPISASMTTEDAHNVIRHVTDILA